MSIASIISEQVTAIPPGQPFTIAKFKQYATGANLRQIFSRLVKSGIVQRITSDIYAKPEIYRGHKIILTGQALIECIEEASGELVITYGANAINQLGLTTQLPMKEMYYYTGKNSQLIINNQEVKLLHINKKYANKSHPILELVLSSAYYLGKEGFTSETLYKMEDKLTKVVLLELYQYLPIMPQWLSNLFLAYYQESGFE